jgi:hypothetical protein
MLYQLSYASRSQIGLSLFRDKTSSDPFLMSRTILKVTITAFCVQGERRAGVHDIQVNTVRVLFLGLIS